MDTRTLQIISPLTNSSENHDCPSVLGFPPYHTRTVEIKHWAVGADEECIKGSYCDLWGYDTGDFLCS